MPSEIVEQNKISIVRLDKDQMRDNGNLTEYEVKYNDKIYGRIYARKYEYQHDGVRFALDWQFRDSIKRSIRQKEMRKKASLMLTPNLHCAIALAVEIISDEEHNGDSSAMFGY